MMIPFNKPYMTGKELWNISQAHHFGHLSGDGPFTQKCHSWLEDRIGCSKALMTNSCTAALEMSAILADINRGDEIILPSYTFVSTANAFVMRGAIPVFIDIREDTLNIDETKIEEAITPKTKAIICVHYAGVASEMDTIKAICDKYKLIIIEDAAQGIMCNYKGRPLGSIGQLAALSFHETKNIISGEGGALLINDPALIERAEIIREKGTDRSKFFRGQVDKYTWVDIGSSFLPSELISAFLWAQMEEAEVITKKRIDTWNIYHKLLDTLEEQGFLRRPFIPGECQQNAHMYYILVSNLDQRAHLLAFLKEKEIQAIFHYVPLHSSPAGRKFGRTMGNLSVTDSVSQRLIRLPFWVGLPYKDIAYICEEINSFFKKE
jgi:dTDP-4-amino-4,6-dideoxygalactose transaminase